MTAGEGLDEVVTRLYDTLRDLAESQINRGPGGPGAVDPTDLVHDCYLKLSRAAERVDLDRPGFVSLAAQVIRNLLVDAARRRCASKRGGDLNRITLHDHSLVEDSRQVDLLDLDQALVQLAKLDERQARIVEMRFFGGLSNIEVGQVLGISAREVSDEWVHARAWLRRAL